MNTLAKILIGMLLLGCLSTSYAINISVRSSSNNVSALGFTVNGKNHGGAGTSYSAKNMPAGQYTFGVRVNGTIFGTDVPCMTSRGQYVTINQDANIILDYNGKSCRLRMS